MCFNVWYVIYIQLQHAQVFHSKTTGKEYQTFCNVNCKTPNVVYLLLCHVSGSQYVGESVQPFNKRMNGHRSELKKRRSFPWVNTLCRRDSHWMTLSDPNIYIIDHNPSWKENQRHTRESFWIRELHMTSAGHKQKSLNLLFFLFILFIN